MNYPMVIYPCEEGGFVAEIPALKGCLAQGETLEDTLQELTSLVEKLAYKLERNSENNAHEREKVDKITTSKADWL